MFSEFGGVFAMLLLILLLLIGLGFFALWRFFQQRKSGIPSMGMPFQQGYDPRTNYGTNYDGPGYGRQPYRGQPYGGQMYGPGYGGPPYGPGYPPQPGMNPWVAGGLGALGGGLLGYELGQMVNQNDQPTPEGNVTSLEQHPIDAPLGDVVPMADNLAGSDYADFGGEVVDVGGADFGGGDFGGGDSW